MPEPSFSPYTYSPNPADFPLMQSWYGFNQENLLFMPRFRDFHCPKLVRTKQGIQTISQTCLITAPQADSWTRHPVLQLFYWQHQPVEEELVRISSLQCLWTLLQAAWTAETSQHEEGHGAGKEEEAASQREEEETQQHD